MAEKSKNVVRLHGERVDLCVLRSDDEAVRLYTEWINNEEFNTFLGQGAREHTLASEKKWAEKERPESQHMFNIVASGVLIGNCEITAASLESGYYVIGIMIGDTHYQGKGYGAEAVRLLCKYGFDALNAYTIELRVHDLNKRAIACYEKVGFRECGRLHGAVYADGSRSDLIIMEMTRDRRPNRSRTVRTDAARDEYGRLLEEMGALRKEQKGVGSDG